MENARFKEALPVWAKGKEREMNESMGFFLQFPMPQNAAAVLTVTGASVYRVFLNGEFLAHGPARAAHGYYRIDRIILPEDLLREENSIAIEVLGVNCNSFYLLDQPSFLQAEVESGEVILGATGKEGDLGFKGRLLTERIKKVQRYSFQRDFLEAYRMTPECDEWRRKGIDKEKEAELEIQADKKLLARHVPYSTYEISPYKEVIKAGVFLQKQEQPLWEDRSYKDISETYKGYPVSELERMVSKEMDEMKTKFIHSLNPEEFSLKNGEMQTIKENEFLLYDMGLNNTGFIGLEIECKEASEMFFVFDEVMINGDIIYNRMGCVNAIPYEWKAGKYQAETIKPYTFRYGKLMVTKGCVKVKRLYIREFKFPEKRLGTFECGDTVINRVFQAGKETFRQNAQDIYMDCPSRERAGWLCDSFFTGRCEWILTGETKVEDNFLENYMLPDKFDFIPKGMVPMCYPSEHYTGEFIPNWGLFMILELEEYRWRNPEEQIVEKLEKRVGELLGYFEEYENEDGLLEDLDGWVFVEWSMANEFTKGVNYPSNMLYAEALCCAGRLYGREDWTKKGEEKKELIRIQSLHNGFFRDHAQRMAGKLVLSEDTTETCQYYAFTLGVADKARDAGLFSVLVQDFGPKRDFNNSYPLVHVSNAFIGNYLRVEMLSKYGLTNQILEETKEFFDYMAQRTGTLWENTGDYASCNHGFASHITYAYYRDLLGIWSIDERTKKITLRFTKQELKWCKGEIPLKMGELTLSWKKVSGQIEYSVTVPSQYEIEVINESGLELHGHRFCRGD